MNGRQNNNRNAEYWRSVKYSLLFTRSNFERLLKKGDFSVFQSTIKEYDSHQIGKKFITYEDYVMYAYKYMLKNYRNEYVYKNSLINSFIKTYGTDETIFMNEFTVGNSIADMVLINGTSRAYEIKTELDTDKRLPSQLADDKKMNILYVSSKLSDYWTFHIGKTSYGPLPEIQNYFSNETSGKSLYCLVFAAFINLICKVNNKDMPHEVRMCLKKMSYANNDFQDDSILKSVNFEMLTIKK